MPHPSPETLEWSVTSILVIGAAVVNWWGRRKTHEQLRVNTDLTRQTHDIANGEKTLLLERLAAKSQRIASMSESPADIQEAEVDRVILERRLQELRRRKIA